MAPGFHNMSPAPARLSQRARTNRWSDRRLMYSIATSLWPATFSDRLKFDHFSSLAGFERRRQTAQGGNGGGREYVARRWVMLEQIKVS